MHPEQVNKTIELNRSIVKGLKNEIKQNTRKNRYYREECKCEFCIDGEKNELIQRLVNNAYQLPKDKIELGSDIINRMKFEAVNNVTRKHKNDIEDFLSKNPKDIKKAHEKFKSTYD